MTYSLANAVAISKHVLGQEAYTAPTAWWVAAHYGSPGPSGTLNEWTGIGRKEITEWTTSTYGWMYNSTAVLWEDLPTPLSGQEEISYYTVWDSETGGTCLRICPLSIAKTVKIGDSLSLPINGMLVGDDVASISTKDFRLVVEDFNDWTTMHDAAWVTTQPVGTVVKYSQKTDSGTNTTRQYSLGVGEGRNGGNALCITCVNPPPGEVGQLPGFWYIPTAAPTNAQPVGEDNYMLQRGMLCNYFEIVMRFPPGYRAVRAAAGGDNVMSHWGTYCRAPDGGNTEETDNYHFYCLTAQRTDLANGDWIKIRYGLKPNHQRNVNVGSYGTAFDPTRPNGSFFSLLTRWYWDAFPYFGDPEIAYPYNVYVDEIAVGWEEPRADIAAVSIQIEDWVQGQQLWLAHEDTTRYNVLVTNTSSDAVTGKFEVHGGNLGRPAWVLTNVDESSITNPTTLAAGESRSYKLVPSYLAKSGTFTANAADDTLTFTSPDSGLLGTSNAVYLSSLGTLPLGLSSLTRYYVRQIVGLTCKLATTNSDTTIVNIQDAGTGVHRMILSSYNPVHYVEFMSLDDYRRDDPLDSWSEGTRPTYVGHPHVYAASAFFRTSRIGAAVYATCEGGLILTCSMNGSVSRVIKARYPDNSQSQISIVAQPSSGGIVVVDTNNQVTFTATPGWTGTTGFNYTCTNNVRSFMRAWVVVE